MKYFFQEPRLRSTEVNYGLVTVTDFLIFLRLVEWRDIQGKGEDYIIECVKIVELETKPDIFEDT